jgi:hypothetical protein
MTTVRKNLGPKLLSGQIRPRPGMFGGLAPKPEHPEPGAMGTPWAVERVALLTAGGMDFYAAFRQVMAEIERAGQP